MSGLSIHFFTGPSATTARQAANAFRNPVADQVACLLAPVRPYNGSPELLPSNSICADPRFLPTAQLLRKTGFITKFVGKTIDQKHCTKNLSWENRASHVLQTLSHTATETKNPTLSHWMQPPRVIENTLPVFATTSPGVLAINRTFGETASDPALASVILHEMAHACQSHWEKSQPYGTPSPYKEGGLSTALKEREAYFIQNMFLALYLIAMQISFASVSRVITGDVNSAKHLIARGVPEDQLPIYPATFAHYAVTASNDQQ